MVTHQNLILLTQSSFSTRTLQYHAGQSKSPIRFQGCSVGEYSMLGVALFGISIHGIVSKTNQTTRSSMSLIPSVKHHAWSIMVVTFNMIHSTLRHRSLVKVVSWIVRLSAALFFVRPSWFRTMSIVTRSHEHKGNGVFNLIHSLLRQSTW